VVVQDVHASKQACLRAITGVHRYTGLVPHVKAVDVYSTETETDVMLVMSIII
jgi:hypothetical protein